MQPLESAAWTFCFRPKPVTALSWADWQLLRADSTTHSTVMLTGWLLEQPILDDGINSNRLCPQRPGAV